MQFIVTDPWFAKKSAIHVDGVRLMGVLVLFVGCGMLMLLLVYHTLIVYGARQGWPIVSEMFALIASREQVSQERYVRDNLAVIAKRVGELQARLMVLDSQSERVAALAGVTVGEPSSKRQKGGGPWVASGTLTVTSMQQTLDGLELVANSLQDDFLTLESQLFSDRLRKWMLPTALPVSNATLGSGFGWRTDPVNGRQALHTGLDFSAEPGAPINAAAGGVVVTQEYHHDYGNMVEIEHGNGLMTRYGHASKIYVARGEIVKRGQHIADVGSSGRSTGPHLHFEVWLGGVVQDPQLFLKESPIGRTPQSAQSAVR